MQRKLWIDLLDDPPGEPDVSHGFLGVGVSSLLFWRTFALYGSRLTERGAEDVEFGRR
jgi:hypothetical protein